MCDKFEAIRLWIEEHHPTYRFIPRSGARTGYCMIENPQRPDIAIEIDFYDNLDSFYVYPSHRSFTGVRTLFAVHISNPTYFNKVDEMISIAKTVNAHEPPEWNGLPLWNP
jgi:hypothetical protein